MGLDGTIKRADGKPLGPIAHVEQALVTAFPGLALERIPSGAEKIRAAAASGIIFPDILLRHFESAPAQCGGENAAPNFSAQFDLGAEEMVHQVDVVLYGTTTESAPMFALLEREYGWITTHP